MIRRRPAKYKMTKKRAVELLTAEIQYHQRMVMTNRLAADSRMNRRTPTYERLAEANRHERLAEAMQMGLEALNGQVSLRQ